MAVSRKSFPDRRRLHVGVGRASSFAAEASRTSLWVLLISDHPAFNQADLLVRLQG